MCTERAVHAIDLFGIETSSESIPGIGWKSAIDAATIILALQDVFDPPFSPKAASLDAHSASAVTNKPAHTKAKPFANPGVTYNRPLSAPDRSTGFDEVDDLGGSHMGKRMSTAEDNIHRSSRRVDRAEDEIRNTGQRVHRAEDEIRNTGQRVHRAEDDIRDTKHRVTRAQADIRSTDPRDGKAEDGIRDTSHRVSRVADEAEPQGRRGTRVENHMVRQGKDVAALKGRVSSTEKNLDLVAKTDGDMAAVKSRMSAAEHDITDLKSSVHKNENIMHPIGGGVGAIGQAVSQAKAANETRVEELNSLCSALDRVAHDGVQCQQKVDRLAGDLMRHLGLASTTPV